MNDSINKAARILTIIDTLHQDILRLYDEHILLLKSELNGITRQLRNRLGWCIVAIILLAAGILEFLSATNSMLLWALNEAGMDVAISRWLAPAICGLIFASIGLVIFKKSSTFQPGTSLNSLSPRKEQKETSACQSEGTKPPEKTIEKKIQQDDQHEKNSVAASSFENRSRLQKVTSS